MTRYLIQRLLEVVPILLGLSVIMFALLAFAPGDPIDLMLSNAPQSVGIDVAALKRAYGLDQPVPVRYVRWLSRVVRGDLGWSIQDRTPVRQMLSERIPRSFLLMGSGLLLAIAVAVPVGIYAALRQYSIGDYVVSIVGFVGFSVPLFWMGLGLIYVFSIKLRWLPPGGYSSQAATGVSSVSDLVRHLILPMVVIALYNMAATMRYTRSAMLEVIRQDYVRTARAKGLSESAVTIRHAARNALIPVVTVLALTLPALIGGAPVTESIFSWPGVGQLLVQSVVAGDLVVAQSVLMMLAAMVLGANILADVAYVLIDPRVRYD
jgi:peptide/nickel transport system permease protein